MVCFTCQGRGYIWDWDGRWMCEVCGGHGNSPVNSSVVETLRQIKEELIHLRQELVSLEDNCEAGAADCCVAPPGN